MKSKQTKREEGKQTARLTPNEDNALIAIWKTFSASASIL
jgi:hypothetical protein